MNESLEMPAYAYRVAADPTEVSVDDLASLIETQGELTYTDVSDDNLTRAGWAFAALHTFAGRTGVHGENPATALGDLLADIRHLCDALGVDYSEVDANGAGHYAEETRA
jgi:hypothetical protein